MPIQPTDDPEIKSMKGINLWVYGKEKYLSKTPESMKEYEKIQPSQELIDFHKMTLAEGHIPQEKIDEADEKLRSYFSMIEDKWKKISMIGCRAGCRL